MSDDRRKPWDPQEGETPAAFEAFCVYRDSEPAEQNLKSVSARHFHTTGEAHRRIRDWSAKYHWVSRALAWVEHKNEIEQAAIQAALLEERKQAARERLDASRLLVKLAFKWAAKNYANAEDLPASTIAPLFKAGVDVSRLEEDLSTEKVDGSVIVKVLRGISMDDL